MHDHEPVEYWEHEVPSDPDAKVEWVPGLDPQLRITSTCSACHRTMIRTWEPGLPSGTKGLWPWPGRTEPVPPPVGPIVFTCACMYGHSNRPPTSRDQGCGAYWPVPMPPVEP